MRDQIIRFRASKAEVRTIKDLAVARGLSMSDLVRRAALGVRMPSRSMDQTEIRRLTQVLGQLGRIGGNLNQLVRRVNAGKLGGHNAEVVETLGSINQLRDQIGEIIR